MNYSDAVIKEALSWMGTPYHGGARVKQAGVDCGQILIAVYEAAGILKPGDCDPGVYAQDWHLHRSEEKYLGWIQRYCDVVEGDPQPGDIALFQYGRCVSHAGIVIEWPRIIHAYIGYGVILSDINEAILCDKKGDSRLRSVYRPRGVSE